jgi:dihydroorotase
MILLQSAKIISTNNQLTTVDILLSQNKIKSIQSKIIPTNEMQIFSLNGKFVSAGFIDMHVHLREPGYEYKETILSGTRAAARGGYTFIACMPNTKPALDNFEIINNLNKKIENEALIRVKPIGALTLGREGLVVANYKDLKKSGVIALSDDGDGIQSEEIMKEALISAKNNRLSVMAHCEDCMLANKGALHEGDFSKRHNIKGLTSASEYMQVRRDIRLAKEINGHYHVCHISTKESIQAVRDAKRLGHNITCEVTPHHILLCDDDIPEVDANFKMNPPLRESSDRKAIIDGLLDGTIDMIATDHAPHSKDEKSREIHCAPFGVVGLETAFPLLYTHLVLTKKLTLKQLIDLMTIQPATVFNLGLGKIGIDEIADLTIIDLEKEKLVDPNEFLSMGTNTPFKNWRLKGWPVMTIVDGKIIWSENE